MPSDWQPVSTLPSLGLDELQLWRINLAEVNAEPDVCREYLSPEELARAKRLRAGQVRMQFLLTRTALRALLGNLLNLPPHQVPITLGAYGKPEVPRGNSAPLFFNCSHSRETILIGLCRASEIGLDLEYLDRAVDILEIARNSFTPNELHEIELCADLAERQRAFFRCWTRKEAVIKADGRGLSIALPAVEVPVLSPAEATPIHVSKETTIAASHRTWFVSDIQLGENLTGAFAVAVPEIVLRPLSFPLYLLAATPSKADSPRSQTPTLEG